MKKLRSRFLVLQIESTLDEVANIFNENQYAESKGIGVLSGTLNNNSIQATFVEKKKVYDEISYPNGDTETQERFKYIYFKFKVRLITKNHYLIQLINAPASIKSFVTFLSKLYSSLIVEKFKFDLSAFHKGLKQHSLVEKVRVTNLKASSLPFSEKSVAKIEVFSESDSYRELKKIYGEKGYRLDRLVFSLILSGIETDLSASSSGAISYSESLDESIAVDSFIDAIKY